MMSDRKALFNDSEFELDRPTSRMVCIYHALSHPVRNLHLRLLAGPLSVSQICERLELKQYAGIATIGCMRKSDVRGPQLYCFHMIKEVKFGIPSLAAPLHDKLRTHPLNILRKRYQHF